jgi:hypothetical protein
LLTNCDETERSTFLLKVSFSFFLFFKKREEMEEFLYYRFITYVPMPNVEEVKAALIKAGAGEIGNYDSCVWETPGIDQFRPLDGSNPAIGEKGVIEKVEEMKLEMIVEKERIRDVISALKSSHPYEVPGLQYWPVFV